MMKIELDTGEISAIKAALELATIVYGADAKLVKAPTSRRDLETRAIFAAQLQRKFDAGVPSKGHYT